MSYQQPVKSGPMDDRLKITGAVAQPELPTLKSYGHIPAQSIARFDTHEPPGQISLVMEVGSKFEAFGYNWSGARQTNVTFNR